MNHHPDNMKRAFDSILTLISYSKTCGRSVSAWLRIGFFRFLLTLFAGPMMLNAATIWTGPPTGFSKLGIDDPNQAVNQDRITANVWITRGSLKGIYNAKTESLFTHNFSPADTEWANGSTSNYCSLHYTDWNTWAKTINGGPPNTVGLPAVVHLKSDDIYIDIVFTNWSTGGDFGYMRSTPPVGNNPPCVFLASPDNGATVPSGFSIMANAVDSDGTVTNVEFFDGATSLGNAASSPYNLPVTLSAGTHTLSAVASDDAGATSPSATVTVTVNAAPSVTITNPVNGGIFVAPAMVTIQASADDSDGTVTNVEFFDGATSLGNVATSPYDLSVILAAGSHTLTAIASDNLGATKTSSSVGIFGDVPPTIAITNPVDGATFMSPATINIQTSANDADGNVTNVQFFDGNTSLGNVSSSPYDLSVGLAVGSHPLTAVVSDNLGIMQTSSVVTVTINASSPPSAVTILNPAFKTGIFSFSFGTQNGYMYEAQFSFALTPTNWMPLTNFLGDGSVVQVIDSQSTNSSRFYRVGAH